MKNKGKKWFTDGTHNTMSFDCPEGWWPGKTQVSGPDHGHYGKPKNYEVKSKFGDPGKTVPWNKGKVGLQQGTKAHTGKTWVVENDKRVWKDVKKG